MAQHEIQTFLEKNVGKFYSVNALSEILNIRKNSVQANVKRMIGYFGVERIHNTRYANNEKNCYKYGIKELPSV